ncbi:MAG: cytochrome c biosis protein CcmG, thiol:disulfide interchange protein DsbE [Actinomycetota bacterium]|jgi:thiol-disulfide isomerase/thioredoxin|nr:cytochrome c biosis protein CcmG, thiol:disulfide interchange protein DsbE [Actinomycetota bacterium]MDT5033392.1 cytochrome c biosis protein CcmG, thiol:disulfide interchange protein DsbE [Actinoplanes sp.]
MNRALVAVAVLGVAGCGGQSAAPASTASARAATTAAARVAADILPPCPVLPRVAPVTGGLPDLQLACLGAGPAVRLSDLRGTPMVLNVWAAWCTNCAREMPIMAAVQRQAGQRLRFFGVHYKAPKAYALQSAVDFGVAFPSVQDEDGDLVVQDLHAYAPPQTLFVTADGRVAGRKIGEIRSRAELTALIREHLGVTL